MSAKHFYTNGYEDRKFTDDEEIPEGWYRGRTNYGKGTKGYIWINNGIDRKYILSTEKIPEGWVRGTLKFTETHKQNLSKSLKGKTRTEEQKERIRESHNTEEYKEKIKLTRLKKYGVENFFQDKEILNKAIKNTCSPEAREKLKKTNLKNLGVEYPMQSEIVKEKSKVTMVKHYGVDSNFKRTEVREKLVIALKSEEIRDKIKQTNLTKWGTENPAQSEEVKSKIRNTNMIRRNVEYPVSNPEVFAKQIRTNRERYGVNYNVQLPQSMIGSRDSKPNRNFAKLLDENDIIYSREFSIGKYIYDFKIDYNLIEINPSVTHNTLWSPFGNHIGIDKDYHMIKSNNGRKFNYRVINIFDWDDPQKIINMFKVKEKIYGRKTVLKEVNEMTADKFLNLNHL